VRLDVGGKHPQSAADEPDGAVGVVAGAAALDERRQPVHLVDQPRVALASGESGECVGDVGQAVAARPALARALPGKPAGRPALDRVPPGAPTK
jgi:hypothetical protein